MREQYYLTAIIEDTVGGLIKVNRFHFIYDYYWFQYATSPSWFHLYYKRSEKLKIKSQPPAHREKVIQFKQIWITQNSGKKAQKRGKIMFSL